MVRFSHNTSFCVFERKMKTRESSFLGEKTHWSVFDKQKN
ncbi:hypothetical protein HMPREF1337_01944 [Enterococcus faecalis ERV65]|nr:Hypothetical protein DENG_00463 [Enterococcus faecalis DENG1]EEI11376.1 hypothetical protein HMPREF0348_2119 [Enterococcus faecalis TX0104]EFT47460.1 hypothetical protein HMPREF9501_01735 [Enterococcus faecalis TX0027]EFU05057.1 hypothetical protein HMPREF9513_02472 [Enterococcus faecalis TX0645]EJU89659.1 hypothetical protein HMPREF1329_01049 [Enterococcus faecalis ERV116]EJU90728.1 hypothetical protein HMPREF1328_00989 [Enterococcus faecalis ERV103]EJU96245.1 hypothetical protein HMPREF1